LLGALLAGYDGARARGARGVSGGGDGEGRDGGGGAVQGIGRWQLPKGADCRRALTALLAVRRRSGKLGVRPGYWHRASVEARDGFVVERLEHLLRRQAGGHAA